MPDTIFTPDLIARHAKSVTPDRAAPQKRDADGRGVYRKVGLPVLLGGNVADLVTTLDAIRDGRGREANPLMGQSKGRIVATKAATTAAEAFLLDKLAKNHRLAALLTALGIGGLGVGLAAHNAKVGK